MLGNKAAAIYIAKFVRDVAAANPLKPAFSVQNLSMTRIVRKTPCVVVYVKVFIVVSLKLTLNRESGIA